MIFISLRNMLLFNGEFLCFLLHSLYHPCLAPVVSQVNKTHFKKQLALATTVTVHTNVSGMSEEQLGNKTLHYWSLCKVILNCKWIKYCDVWLP